MLTSSHSRLPAARWFVGGAAALLALLVGCRHSGPGRTTAPPGEGPLRVEVIPRPLHASAHFTPRGELGQVFFHLNLENRGTAALEIRSVVIDAMSADGSRLSRKTLGAALLRRRLRPVGWTVMRDRQTLAAAHRHGAHLRQPKGDTVVNGRGVIALTNEVAVHDPETLPASILCTVHHSAGQASTRVQVHRHQQATRLTLPVQGRWWVMAGHRRGEHHGDAIIASQSFAYDLGVVGPDVTTFSGDPRRNPSYLAHGRPIVAAADGDVVAVHDGVPENNPVGVRPAWQSILRQPWDLAGNFVVLRHEGSEHTAYLHLRPGLTVRPGQRVTRGQTLGLCGNSGNSLEPHVHFQLQDGPDPMRAKGLPARFSDFTIHLAHLRIHVPRDRSSPLPLRLTVEPGRVP